MQEVYPAGEMPIAGADSKSLCRAIRLRGQVEPVFIKDNSVLLKILPGVLSDGDVLLTLGAGDIGSTSVEIVEKLGVHRA